MGNNSNWMMWIVIAVVGYVIWQVIQGPRRVVDTAGETVTGALGTVGGVINNAVDGVFGLAGKIVDGVIFWD